MCRVVVVAVVVLALALPSAAAAEELRAGTIIDRPIAGAQADSYDLPLAAGEYANIAVDQRGIDVVVSVLDAGGKVLADVEDEVRDTGAETLTVAADTATTFRLRIKPRYARAPGGHYVLRVLATGTAGDKETSRFEATKLIAKAESLRNSGKMEEARKTAEQAFVLAERASPDDPFLASIAVHLGLIQRTLGEYANARITFERARAIDEKTVGTYDPRTALALDAIGMTYLYENDYAAAQALLQEGLTRTERSVGGEHPAVIVHLQNLAIAYQDLNDKKAAIAALDRALHICEKYLDPEDFQFTAIVNNLGTLYREMHDYDRAEPMLQRSLHMVETKLGIEHPFIATPLQELGIIARERKQYDRALEILWRGEAAREKAYGLRHPQTIATLIVIANTYDAAGQHDRALDLQQRILESVEASCGPYHNLTLIALANLAKTYEELGNASCAVEYQARMDEVLEKNLELKLAIGSERQKLAYQESMTDRTDRTISLHVNEVPDDRAAAEHALLVLLQRKARVLDAMTQNLAIVRNELDRDSQSLLDHLQETTAELAKVALGSAGSTPAAQYRARVKKLEGEKDDLEAAISARSAQFRADHQPVTLAAIRAAIPRDAALVEFSVYRPFHSAAARDDEEFGDPRYIAYVLRRTGPVAWKDLGSAKAIDDAIAAWRQALRDPDRDDVDHLARAVDGKVMEPLRALAGDARHLLIAPDGQLDLVPFEALVDARNTYAIQRYAITYLTSGRDLLRMEVPRPSRTAAMIVADPFYGDPAGSPPKKIASAMAQRRSITSGEDLSSVYFAPLAGTKEEARRIHALFPEARLLTGRDATKNAMQRLDAPRILHVATHGFFLDGPSANPLLRSGLALSGANRDRTRAGGLLTALEASNLNLWGTKLVTLSACDSGVGEVKLREGVYGLRRAFFLAGAETVVMSLWPVSDYATRQMMTAYYSGLNQGLGRGDALRRAQLAMLKSRRHPFYWASFIQSGDWKPLR